MWKKNTTKRWNRRRRRMERPSNDPHKNNFSSLRLRSALFTVRMILPFIQLVQYHWVNGRISFAFHSSWPVNVSLNKSIIVSILRFFICMWQACRLFTCFLFPFPKIERRSRRRKKNSNITVAYRGLFMWFTSWCDFIQS